MSAPLATMLPAPVPHDAEVERLRVTVPASQWPMCADPRCGERLDPLWWSLGVHGAGHCTAPDLTPAAPPQPDATPTGPCLNPWCAQGPAPCGFAPDTHYDRHGAAAILAGGPVAPRPTPKPAPGLVAGVFTPLPVEHPVKTLMRAVIQHAASNAPRSLQATIGPSEIGSPCLRRLAYQTNGVPKGNAGRDLWFAVIGTAVHDWLAHAIEVYQHDVLGRPYAQRRFWVEERVTVSADERGAISGSCDLYDADEARVIDHKVVGNDDLKRYVAEGPGDQYRAQVHLYGLGHVNAGRPVREVAIAFYPRSNYLANMHVWSEPWQPQIALDALRRLGSARALGATLGAAGAWQHIPDAPGHGCAWCPFWRGGDRPADATGCPGEGKR